jgi:hypothetical protein
MKSLPKILFLLVVISALSSCSYQRPIQKIAPENNKTYSVYYLFEHDGCKVYRFQDMGSYVYFTNCNSDVTSISSDSIKTRVVNTVFELKTE